MKDERTSNFIEKARKIHGDKYNYSKVEYVNSKTKVCIICPEHGEFLKSPLNHIQCKQGCPICSKNNKIRTNKKLTINDFIERSVLIHGEKYNYSKSNYVDNKTPLCIICPKHGEFWQVPHIHMKGFGCPKCAGKIKKNINDFIEKANLVHNNKYSYEKVIYKNTDTKVTVTCPIHGDFEITPHHHLDGVGCTKCAGNYQYNTEEIINLFKKIHGNKFNYSKVKYENTHKKIKIICSKHGEFLQTPKAHLTGQGCPICKHEYTKSETKLYEVIKKLFPDIIRHYRPDFLKTHKNGKQEIDLYIPSINVGIEYQGKQHFEPVIVFGGINGYEKTVILDNIKYKKCKENNIKLIYFSYEKNIPDSYLDKIYTNESEIIEYLNSFNND